MHVCLSDILRRRLVTVDDSSACVIDCLFDECAWKMRYLVIDTGNWLPGRQLLISPVCVHAEAWCADSMIINLTSEQMEHSPDVDSAKPVSRKCEERIAEHYGWPMYWLGDVGAGVPVTHIPGPERSLAAEDIERQTSLRSFMEVQGYDVHDGNGRMGSAADFIVDTAGARLVHLVVNTGNWIRDRKVKVACENIEAIDWAETAIRTITPGPQ